MADQQKLLKSLGPLKEALQQSGKKEEVFIKAERTNPWFTLEFINASLQSILDEFIDPAKCAAWLGRYKTNPPDPKRVGLIMAGNIPLVGFHDLFCVLCSGHKAVIKLSDKDPYLLPFILEEWSKLLPEISDSVRIVEKLDGIDAVIATGSNNSARYFEYYFKKYPHVFRRNRNGVAILDGNETKQDLQKLGNDIFMYFGLGCRNVSKIFVPGGYSFENWPESLKSFEDLGHHNKYRNNLDYNYTIYLINNVPHINLGHLILKEDDAIASRIGCLHFSYYNSQEEVDAQLNEHRGEIQCIVSNEPKEGWEWIPFGFTQQPKLDQYADGVDTMEFLSQL